MKNWWIAVILFCTACAPTAKEKTSSQINDFLVSFEQSIATKDSVGILAHFKTRQDPGVIFAAMEFLENLEPEVITYQADFKEASLFWDTTGLRVNIGVKIRPTNHQEEFQFFTLWLGHFDGKFYIIKLDAENFYHSAMEARYLARNEGLERDELARFSRNFGKAKELQSKYDSVIWFINTDNRSYYYVVNGAWGKDPENLADTLSYKMGLVDESEKVIVPAQYDLVGAPGTVWPGIVEVSRKGKVGYYSLEGKELFVPLYDLAVPYFKENISILVKKDSTDGWLDTNFAFHEGFANNEARRYLKEYRFLERELNLNSKSYPICRVPAKDFLSSGYMLAPSYMVRYGLVNSITGNVFTGYNDGRIMYRINSIEKKSFDIFDLPGSLNLLITNFQRRYFQGRQEFYAEGKFALVNGVQDTLSTGGLSPGEIVKLRLVTDSLLEVKFKWVGWGEPDEIGVFNFIGYEYYKVKGARIIKMNSNRSFQETEFVKLDSSYFRGEIRWINSDGKLDSGTFAPPQMLESIRTDILAAYGYTFSDQFQTDHYSYLKWYVPSRRTYDEVYQAATEIDKHNLDFLSSLIGEFKPEPLKPT